jgi:DNA helicase-2/ATP-dependent DNA helicase PcrA
MTIHKSKGKQFDAVILVRESMQENSLFASLAGDAAPCDQSRKILRLGSHPCATLRSDA